MGIPAHENLCSIEPLKGSSDRCFGLVFAGLFVLLGLAPLRHGLVANGQLRWAGLRPGFVTAGGVLLMVSLAAPRVLHPANHLWAKFAALVHRLATPVAMGVIFFLIATPVGILMRLLGKDPLKLHFDRRAESYWCRRTPPGPDPGTMSNQF